MAPKILILDIETQPHKVYVWGLYNQDVAINQIVEPGRTLCWAARWHGQHPVLFSSVWTDGKRGMVKKIHSLLSEADIVVHYNGTKFDLPTLNREFVLHGMPRPAPYRQVDLYLSAKSEFKFPSNKLDYICQELGIGSKLPHKGMELWRSVMNGDKKAQETMKKYNKQDVVLTGKLYDKLLPWLKNHPNTALYGEGGSPACTKCGSHKGQFRGYFYTQTSVFRRWRCSACGNWDRMRKNEQKRPELLVAIP